MFDSFSVRTFVNGLLGGGRIGTIFAFSGQMAQFVPEGARQRFILDFVDMDSAKFAAYADKGGALAWLYPPEAERLFDFERVQDARHSVVEDKSVEVTVDTSRSRHTQTKRS